jgi:hypothetical protein
VNDTGTAPAGGATRAPEDPLAADKRTLTIGAASMVGLILVGVVSAQLFVRGGCEPLGDPVAVDTEVVDAEVALTDVGLDGAGVGETLGTALDAALTAGVEVGDATGITTGTDGLVLTGPQTTALALDGGSSTRLDTGGAVVGSGDTLYELNLANPGTGQVDAFTPVASADLQPGGCTDTAVVGEAFAFLLDAGDGQMLLFRSEEDGDAAVAQLRDGDTGAWDLPLGLPAGSPGVLAERLTGALGPDRVVVARRVAPDDPDPVVIVAGRADGTADVEVSRDEVIAGLDLPGDVALRVAVHAVDDRRALLSAAPDPAQADDQAPTRPDTLGLLDLDDGSIERVGGTDGRVVDGALDGDRLAAVFADDGGSGDGGVSLLVEELGAGASATPVLEGQHVATAFADGIARVATDRVLARAGSGDSEDTDDALDRQTLPDGVEVRDLVIAPDGTLLVLVGTGDRQVLLAAAPDALTSD